MVRGIAATARATVNICTPGEEFRVTLVDTFKVLAADALCVTGSVNIFGDEIRRPSLLATCLLPRYSCIASRLLYVDVRGEIKDRACARHDQRIPVTLAGERRHDGPAITGSRRRPSDHG